jgi:hypothetical protein
VIVPWARSLLEIVYRTVQPTDVLGASRVDEADGLATLDDLGELAVEEGILDVEMVSLPLRESAMKRMTRTMAGLTTGLNVSSKSMPCF